MLLDDDDIYEVLVSNAYVFIYTNKYSLEIYFQEHSSSEYLSHELIKTLPCTSIELDCFFVRD